MSHDDDSVNYAYHLENTLKWIRLNAGLHYFGGAFDPEHMRRIANLATDAIAGESTLPDFDEAMAESKEKAAEWADRMSIAWGVDDVEDETGHDPERGLDQQVGR